MAIIEVPYSYTQVGYRPRSSTRTSMAMGANLLLRIPEIGSEHAPLVARCSYRGHRLATGNHGVPAWVEDDLHTDYRVVDGQLLRRALFDDEFLAGGTLDDINILEYEGWPARIAALPRDGAIHGQTGAELAMDIIRIHQRLGSKVRHLMLPAIGVGMAYDSALSFDPALLVRHERNNRAINEQQNRAGLQNRIVLVDGALYVPSRGPAWCAIERHRDDHAGLQAMPELAWVKPERLIRTYLPADPLVSSAVELPGINVSGNRHGNIEVVVPGDWQLDPDAFAVQAALNTSATGQLASYLFVEGHTDALCALAHLRAIMALDPPDTAGLLQAMGRLVGQIGLEPDTGWKYHAMRACIQRHQRRQMLDGTLDLQTGAARTP